MKVGLTRRSFLKALGLSASVAPFVPCLNRFAEAQTTPAFPRRLLLTYAPNGTVESKFWPVGTETAFTFPAGQITESLAPFRSSLVFAKGLTRTKAKGGGPHEIAMGSLWTGSALGPSGYQSGGYGFPTTPSIDQIIVGKVPQPTPFASLALSVAHDQQLPGADQHAASKYMTYAGANQPVLPDADPYHVFRTLVLTGGVGGPVTLASVERARQQMTSVIDLVQGDLKVLSTKIDADDRAKVDAHVQGLREIETRVQAAQNRMGAPQGAACNAPALPQGYAGNLHDNDSFPALVKMQADLMVAALACDQTRIASLQWSRSLSLLRHTWLGDPHAPEHHLNSHETTDTAVNWQYRMSTWYCQQLSELLTKLAAVKEGSGTMLDNMLVVWSYDMNLGAGHILAPHVVVLAGGLGGKTMTAPTGRLVDYQGKYDWTQLLVTICNAMGATDVNVVGDLGVPGSIPGLFRA
jgi:hypothetical protein